MAKKKISEKRKFTSPTFRVSFPHVFKPQKMPGAGGDVKYSVVALYKKDADLTKIKEAMRAAKVDHFGEDKSKWPEIESPVVDGDMPKFKDREGYKGHYAIKFSSREDQKPVVVDESNEPIIDPAKFYPGCHAIARVFASIWEFPENSGNFGVGFYLDGVQKVKDDKSFGGREPADKMFAPVSNDAADDDIDDDDFR